MAEDKRETNPPEPPREPIEVPKPTDSVRGNSVSRSAVDRTQESAQQVTRDAVRAQHTEAIAGPGSSEVGRTGPEGTDSEPADVERVRAGDVSAFKTLHGLDPEAAADLAKLSDDELIEAFNNPLDGDRVLVTGDGRLLGGHHRIAELQTRTADGRIHPDTLVRIEVFDSARHAGNATGEDE